VNQPALFDPRNVTDTRCPVPGCQAILWAGTTKTPTCAYDLEIERKHPRPKGCANTTDPAFQEIPY